MTGKTVGPGENHRRAGRVIEGQYRESSAWGSGERPGVEVGAELDDRPVANGVPLGDGRLRYRGVEQVEDGDVLTVCDRRLVLDALDHAVQPGNRLDVILGPLKAIDRAFEAQIVRQQGACRSEVACRQGPVVAVDYVGCSLQWHIPDGNYAPGFWKDPGRRKP